MTIGQAGAVGRATIGGVAIGVAIGAALAAAAAQRVPDDGPDIVVTGGVPVMVAGLWRFRSGTTHSDVVPGLHGAKPRRGSEWTVCVGDGDTKAILDQLVGRQATFGDDGLCSALRVAIDRDRVSGSRRCQLGARMTSNSVMVGAYVDTRFDATITAMTLTAWYTRQAGFRDRSGPKMRWPVAATRIGACDASSPARLAAPVITHSDAAMPETPIESATPPLAPDAAPAAGAATDPPQLDDIVVIGRKLRRLRLHYASSGRAFRWCHADVSSGDPRLDRIGCAIVRSCVRAGFDEPGPALACFRQRVDTLATDTDGAAPSAAAGQSR